MLVDRIKSLFSKKRGLLITISLALVGVLLLCIPSGGENKEDVPEKTAELSEYKARLEEELADTCTAVLGVGKCRVMIMFEKGAENVYKGSQLVESTPPKVAGVTVVCAGGNSSEVRSALTEMLSALFGIGKNRIAILELKK
ncbi:MAG: hypothetical protein IKY62_02810 [Clostridia bacterium]|nr:hypothetical protein [Clostridia bacterium]